MEATREQWPSTGFLGVNTVCTLSAFPTRCTQQWNVCHKGNSTFPGLNWRRFWGNSRCTWDYKQPLSHAPADSVLLFMLFCLFQVLRYFMSVTEWQTCSCSILLYLKFLNAKKNFNLIRNREYILDGGQEIIFKMAWKASCFFIC